MNRPCIKYLYYDHIKLLESGVSRKVSEPKRVPRRKKFGNLWTRHFDYKLAECEVKYIMKNISFYCGSPCLFLCTVFSVSLLYCMFYFKTYMTYAVWLKSNGTTSIKHLFRNINIKH